MQRVHYGSWQQAIVPVLLGRWDRYFHQPSMGDQHGALGDQFGLQYGLRHFVHQSVERLRHERELVAQWLRQPRLAERPSVAHRSFEHQSVGHLALAVQQRAVRRYGFRRCAVRQWSSPLRDLGRPRRAYACTRHTLVVFSASI